MSKLRGKIAILEPSVVFLIICWLCFVLKPLSSITKKRFVSKILSKVSSKLPVNVSNSPWNWLVDPYNPVDTRRRFNVYKTSPTLYRRLIDVETMSCVYWERYNFEKFTAKFLIQKQYISANKKLSSIFNRKEFL